MRLSGVPANYALLITSAMAAIGAFGFGVIPLMVLSAVCVLLAFSKHYLSLSATIVLSTLTAIMTVSTQASLATSGTSAYWLLFWGHVLSIVLAAGYISLQGNAQTETPALQRYRRSVPPAVVPIILLLLWQGLVTGYQVPKGIFPSVGNVSTQLTNSLQVLLRDSYITFIKEVLLGFIIGLSAGFLTGVAIAYNRFLQKGFLPLAAAFGAVPIVGLAPVLGRAFGVDWESKAAVVVIVTFFPVVLNTVQGMTQIDPLKLELLRAYAASPRDVFFKLRLPNALPYVFNALKLAVVLSVISVIVAEFLIPGPPEGLGQRISLSARRGAYDVVFAAIIVSSVISLGLYGLLSMLEKSLTGWHPSFREDR